MFNLLEQLLKKRGIGDVTKLTDEEKVVFDDYQQKYDLLLAAQEAVTPENVALFCRKNMERIEERWADPHTTEEQAKWLIPLHTSFSMIEKMIKAPQSQRESLEKHLLDLIEK
jgi:hypothetical protein